MHRTLNIKFITIVLVKCNSLLNVEKWDEATITKIFNMYVDVYIYIFFFFLKIIMHQLVKLTYAI